MLFSKMKNIGLSIILLMSACTVYAGVPSRIKD